MRTSWAWMWATTAVLVVAMTAAQSAASSQHAVAASPGGASVQVNTSRIGVFWVNHGQYATVGDPECFVVAQFDGIAQAPGPSPSNGVGRIDDDDADAFCLDAVATLPVGAQVKAVRYYFDDVKLNWHEVACNRDLRYARVYCASQSTNASGNTIVKVRYKNWSHVYNRKGMVEVDWTMPSR